MDQLFPNGVWHYLGGGLLIGAGVAFLFVTTGLIGGASTFFSSTLSFVSKGRFFQQERLTSSRGWRLVYALGMLCGTVVVVLIVGSAPVTAVPSWQLVVGGFLVGFGARLSNGCTSGHGICGLASFQLPSLLAVVVFLGTAMLTANLVAAVGGPR